MPRKGRKATKTKKDTKKEQNAKETVDKKTVATISSSDHIKKIKKELIEEVNKVEQLIEVSQVQNTAFGVIILETVDGTREVYPNEIVSLPKDKVATYMKKPVFKKGKLSRVGLSFDEYQPQEWPTDRIQALKDIDPNEFKEIIREVVVMYPWIGKRLYDECKRFGLTEHALVVRELIG